MKIKCSIICKVTENWKGGKEFEVPLYEARHYSNISDFKIEYKLVVCRINSKHEEFERLKEGTWFVKSFETPTTRFISFADVTFAYSEKNDEIYIQRDYITV